VNSSVEVDVAGLDRRGKSFVAITRRIFFTADTITIRLLLATASLGWAVALMFNLVLLQPIMDRPAYVLLRWVASDWWWAAVFFMHFAGVTWRLYDPQSRPIWALAINAYGFLIWTFSTACITVAVGTFVPGTALEWTMCAASAWALYRTGLTKEAVTP